MKSKLTILTFLVLVMTSCKKDDFPIDKDTIQVTIKNSDTYSYSTGVGGDEDGAKIIRQANNFEISELRRNQTTNWVVFYDYKPKSNFTGKDYVEIETYEGSNGARPPTTINTVKILINVTK
jgi:hypothetical protein